MTLTASGLFNADQIPQDLVTGVVVTLIGLVLVFSIKPRLTIGLDPTTNDQLAFIVCNTGRMQVIEIRAKLFWIDTAGLRTRHPIGLEISELFQLSGTWTSVDQLAATPAEPVSGPSGQTASADSPSGPSPGEKQPRSLAKNEFRFKADKLGVADIELKNKDYLLLQVVARHGFSNFTRLAIRRFPREEAAVLLEQISAHRGALRPDKTAPPGAGAHEGVLCRRAGRLTAKGATWLQPDGIP
jgi:hypothetical protein